MQNTNYSESKEFWRPPTGIPPKQTNDIPGIEQRLCEYILNNSEKGNPQNVINKIDQFCLEHWMMNLGPQKGNIVKNVMGKHSIKRVVEIGGYCGYSALVFANEIKGVEGAKILTVEVNPQYISVAKRIHQHAGLDHIIEYNLGPVSESAQNLKKNGPFDMIFIDHIKYLYLSDFKLMEQYGVVKQGTLVVGDNIFYPGCPEYLEHMKHNTNYNSILYHSYLEYCDIPDAVLTSVKL